MHGLAGLMQCVVPNGSPHWDFRFFVTLFTTNLREGSEFSANEGRNFTAFTSRNVQPDDLPNFVAPHRSFYRKFFVSFLKAYGNLERNNFGAYLITFQLFFVLVEKHFGELRYSYDRGFDKTSIGQLINVPDCWETSIF